MKIRLLAIIGCCFLLGACASNPSTQTNEAASTQDAYAALAEAAGSVSQSLTRLGETEQAAYPPVSVSEPPSPASYGMAIPTSIEWSGPVQPVVLQIANATNYKLQVLGKAPSIPIIVSVSAKNATMGDVLRDIGYQCGNHANIVIFPSTHLIELRYANT
jgi:defect in organelle trafficking protein DotD